MKMLEIIKMSLQKRLKKAWRQKNFEKVEQLEVELENVQDADAFGNLRTIAEFRDSELKINL